MPKLSVIIPVYNTEAYLPRCLGSITNQTLDDIEVICVNDASSDGSCAMLQKYARNDSRILVVDLERQQGAAVARNIALEKATGEYVGFIDSDDYIDVHYFEALYQAATNKNTDIAKCNRKTFEIDGSVGTMEFNESVRRDKYCFNKGFTTAIYRRAMLEQNAIRFPAGLTNHEDIVFLIKAVHWANNIATVDNAWYFCEKRNDSSSWGIAYAKRLASCCAAVNMILEFVNSVDIDKEPYAFIMRTEILAIYSQGSYQKDEDAAKHCMALFARCKNQEDILALLPHRFALLLKNADLPGLVEFYQHYRAKESVPVRTLDMLRSQVRGTLY